MTTGQQVLLAVLLGPAAAGVGALLWAAVEAGTRRLAVWVVHRRMQRWRPPT
jgi:hypothetical protein